MNDATTSSRTAIVIALSAVVTAGIAVACGSTHRATASNIRRCSSAIYSVPLAAGARPPAHNAVIIGRAIFNDLRGAREKLDRPRRLTPFYTYKSPLTIWGSNTVYVTVARPRSTVRLLYDVRDLQSLGKREIRLAALPTQARLETCMSGKPGVPKATQYNGGFALAEPTCVTIEVRSSSSGKRRLKKIPFGVDHC